MSPSRIDLLQRMPIFGALRDDTLRVLLARAGERTVRAGEYLFREHDDARSMYVLEQGSASVYKHGQGRDHLIKRLHVGDCVGEMALIDLMPRSASVRADTDCRAIELGPDDLLRVFEHDVEQFALIHMNLGRELSRRLRATDELLFRFRIGEDPA